jgi:hypothetical protein
VLIGQAKARSVISYFEVAALVNTVLACSAAAYLKMPCGRHNSRLNPTKTDFFSASGLQGGLFCGLWLLPAR